MAEAIRYGYADLYKRNEFVHSMDKHKLEGLIMEVTGLEKDSQTLKAIASTFEALKAFANFELTGRSKGRESEVEATKKPPRSRRRDPKLAANR